MRAAVGTVIEAGPDGAHLIGVRGAVGAHQACGDCGVCGPGGGAIARLLGEILIAKNAAPVALGELGVRPAKLFAVDAHAAAATLAAAPPRSTVTIAMLGEHAIDVAAALAREVTVIGVVGA